LISKTTAAANAEISRQSADRPKLWNKSYVYLMFISLISGLSFSMVQTTLPKYVVSIGGTLTIAGTIAGIFSITALIFRPLSGISVDVFNKKILFAVSTLIMGFIVLFYSFSQNIGLLFFFRIIHGAAFAISGTASTTLVALYIPKKRLSEGIGYFGLGQIIAQAIGPSVGVAISNTYGYSPMFYVTCALGVAAAIMIFLFRFDTEIEHKNTTEHQKIKITFNSLIAKEVLVYSILVCMISLSNGICTSFIQLYGDYRHISNIGLFFTVGAIMLIFIRPFAGKLADKKGFEIIIYPSLIITAVAMAMIGFSWTLPMICIAAALRSVGQGAGQPTLQAECLKAVSPTRSGVAMSTYFIGADVGNGLGPIIGGVIAQRTNYTVMFYSIAAIMLLTTVIYFLYQLHCKNKSPQIAAH